MSTVDTTAAQHDAFDHDDDHHDHGEFIAHHFDNAEQQYDSGKLGIWVFLVTEVLFFSGLFCAYVLYRYHHPELFVDASEFLDKVLGGINTIVLLFSSLTMAWAVRSAQLGNNKFAGQLILITMVCAAIFLGIKAVEYSHKWDLRILPISHYDYVEGYHPAHDEGLAGSLGVSQWLINLSLIPALMAVFFGGMAVVCKLQLLPSLSGKHLPTFFAGLAIMMGGFFLGVVGGQLYQNAVEPSQDTHELSEAGDGHAAEQAVAGPVEKYPPDVGIFFSIYYCMTGLHAIHVIGGMVALSWLFYRCLRNHFRPDYFGPVDFVGLYWHLVDLIWIFLFPLLYLIN